MPVGSPGTPGTTGCSHWSIHSPYWSGAVAARHPGCVIAPSIANRRPCNRESMYASRLTLPSVSSAIFTQNFSLPPVQKYQVSRPARWASVR